VGLVSVCSRENVSGKIGKISGKISNFSKTLEKFEKLERLHFLLLTILGTITKKRSFFEVLIA